METISRKGLHEKLWSTRITILAEELNIKDYTLRKICEEHNLPRPKSGYWSKLKFGKNPPKTILQGNVDEQINIGEYQQEEKSTVQYRVTNLTQELKDEYEKNFNVPKKLKNQHHLIKRLKSELLRRGAYDGLLHTYGGENLYVTVSKANMTRFLRIIETFVSVLELRGHSIRPDWKKSKVTIKGQEFDIKFIEKSNRKTISDGRWDRTTLVPSGKLTIRSRVSWNDKEWKDGSDDLEVQLPKIVAYLEVKADDEIQKEIEWERKRKEQERLRKIEEEKRAMKQWEEDKEDLLIQDAQKWHELTNLKLFLEELHTLKSSKLSEPEVEKWLQWADSVLDERDFIKSDLKSYIKKYEYKSKNEPRSQ